MKRFNLIYADPPWQYSQKSAGRGNKSGAGDKYSTMSLDDLMCMPIPQISEDDAVLFMWATTPLLPDAFRLMSAWGFKYKTMITWEKTGLLGMGNWLRVQTEFLLIGIKGNVKPFKHQERNIYRHKVCKHSAKPHFFRQKVVELASKSLTDISKLELFARSRGGLFSNLEYEGWEVFGNEVDNSITLPEPIAA